MHQDSEVSNSKTILNCFQILEPLLQPLATPETSAALTTSIRDFMSKTRSKVGCSI